MAASSNGPPSVGVTTSATTMLNGAMTANVASNLSAVCQWLHMRRACSANRARIKGGALLFTSAVLMATQSALSSTGCAAAVPEPREDVQAFARAVAKKDARAVHAMLDEETRRNVTEQQVALLLRRDGDEIARRAQLFSKTDPEVRAHVNLSSGQQVELSGRDGAFYVASPSLNDTAPLSPMEAVGALRRALEAGSYTALLQVLTPELREQVEQQRKRLIEALRYEEALELTEEGERLVIDTADGHRVILERKMGVWRVHDFN